MNKPVMFVREMAEFLDVPTTQVRNWYSAGKCDFALEDIPNPQPNPKRPTLLAWVGPGVERTKEQLAPLAQAYRERARQALDARLRRVNDDPSLAHAPPDPRWVLTSKQVPKPAPTVALPVLDFGAVSAVRAALYEVEIVRLKKRVRELEAENAQLRARSSPRAPAPEVDPPLRLPRHKHKRRAIPDKVLGRALEMGHFAGMLFIVASSAVAYSGPAGALFAGKRCPTKRQAYDFLAMIAADNKVNRGVRIFCDVTKYYKRPDEEPLRLLQGGQGETNEDDQRPEGASG